MKKLLILVTLATLTLAFNRQFSLFKVDSEQARCLDGSQPGYYFHQGDPSKVLIHFLDNSLLKGLTEADLLDEYAR
jgi:hypothetical protein